MTSWPVAPQDLNGWPTDIPPPPTTPCLPPPPTSKDNGRGYHKLSDGTYAHRAAYEAAYGPIPVDRPELDHLCRRPWCRAVDHLEAVTHEENSRRGMSGPGLNSRKTSCPKCGGAYSTSPSGRRRCDPCRRKGRQSKGEISAKGRKVERTHCPQKHPYDAANTYIARWPDGSFKSRHCRKCGAERERRRSAARKAAA